MFQPTSYDQQLIELLEKRLEIISNATKEVEKNADELGLDSEEASLHELGLDTDQLRKAMLELDGEITALTISRVQEKRMINTIKKVDKLFDRIKEEDDLNEVVEDLFK